MSKRAWRRHHIDRLKENRKDYWGRERKNTPYFTPLTPRQLGVLVNTPHPCSSYCCGNPCKWFKEITFQEKRWLCVEE